MNLTFDIQDEFVKSVREAYKNYVILATSKNNVKAKKAEATFNHSLKTVLSQINEQLEEQIIEAEDE